MADIFFQQYRQPPFIGEMGIRMKYFTKEITTGLPDSGESPALLRGYIPDNLKEVDAAKKHPAVLILPGGAYFFTSEREGEGVALKLMSEGICAFVLNYHVAPVRFPVALCEALLSLQYIRENCEEWNIDADNISVLGFSAGGHLAASVGVHWSKACILKNIPEAKKELVKPNKLLLSYPVITSGEYAHNGSMLNLLGEENQTQELLEFNSLEKQVTKDTPKSFIWHTYEDASVPVQNAMLFATALIQEGITTELHVYPKGGHGLSLGNHIVNGGWEYGKDHDVAEWIERAVKFIYTV